MSAEVKTSSPTYAQKPEHSFDRRSSEYILEEMRIYSGNNKEGYYQNQ